MRYIDVEVKIIQRGLISPSTPLPENVIIVACVLYIFGAKWTYFQYSLSLNVNPMYVHYVCTHNNGYVGGTWLRCSDKHVKLPLSVTHYGVWRCGGRYTQGSDDMHVFMHGVIT